MVHYTAHVLAPDGVGHQFFLTATDVAHARQLALQYATKLCPRGGFTFALWPRWS